MNVFISTLFTSHHDPMRKHCYQLCWWQEKWSLREGNNWPKSSPLMSVSGAVCIHISIARNVLLLGRHNQGIVVIIGYFWDNWKQRSTSPCLGECSLRKEGRRPPSQGYIFTPSRRASGSLPSILRARTINGALVKSTPALKLRHMLLKAIERESELKKKKSAVLKQKEKALLKKKLY